ncbi:MAG: hypothetical protein ACRDP3_23035 [Streptomyces sp.]|uniref:hypothetical protein n=1 Tax=Streptomyces sp. TaxID=1931 RepID=UPI003D6B0477
MKTIGERFGTGDSDLARAAVQYALHGVPEASALVGFRSASQITAVLARATEPVNGEDMSFLRDVMSPVREKSARSTPDTPANHENSPTHQQRRT